MLFKKVQKVLLKFGTEDNMQRLLTLLLKVKLESQIYNSDFRELTIC
jgi:hypothetical protein